MSLRKMVTAVLVLLPASVVPAAAGPISLTNSFGLNFSASQSLWAGGPNAGLDASGKTPGSAVGAYYAVKANSGTVTASQNGSLQATYLSELPLGSVSIALQFIGSSGSAQALFGASAKSGVFLDISGCFGGVVFGACVGIPYDIDTDIPIIDEGFFLNPVTSHVPVIDTLRSATDADQAAGVGAGPSIGTFRLGPSMNLDLEQTISFRPTGLTGLACYQNQVTPQNGCIPFDVPTSGISNLVLNLGAGIWDVTFQNVALQNTFRNDIDLELRPAFDYLVGSWPPVGQELFAFGLIDQTFALNFNQVANAGTITVSVVEDAAAVPEPATLLLTGAGLLVVAYRWRRRAPSTTNRTSRRTPAGLAARARAQS